MRPFGPPCHFGFCKSSEWRSDLFDSGEMSLFVHMHRTLEHRRKMQIGALHLVRITKERNTAKIKCLKQCGMENQIVI